MSKQRNRASQVFNYLHKIWETDGYSYLGGLTSERVKEYLSTRKLNFHLNSYMDLTIDDICYYVKNFRTLKEVKKDMEESYSKDYAESWFENLIWVLAQKTRRAN